MAVIQCSFQEDMKSLHNVVGKKIGFKEIISNKPVSKNGMLTGELKGKIIDGKGKLNCLKKRVKNS